jgi:rRNA maturation protein Nop10
VIIVCIFDQKYFLDGTCPRCGGNTLLSMCILVSDEYEFGRKEVSLEIFKYVSYDIDGG